MTDSTDRLSFAVEFRTDDSRESPGRLFGVLMKYGTLAKSRAERFAAGAFTWPEAGIPLNCQHERRNAFMRTVPVASGDTVIIDAPLPDTSRGRDIAVEMRSEQPLYSGMSAEFVVREQRFESGLRIITRADLVGAALDTSPDYDAPISVRTEAGLSVVRREALLWL